MGNYADFGLNFSSSALAVAKIMRSVFEKNAAFEKIEVQDEVWSSFEEDLFALLLDEYATGNFAIYTSDYLEASAWEELPTALAMNRIPENVALKNLSFELKGDNSADIKCFNAFKGKNQLIGTFNFNDEGEITYLYSYQNDNMDALTSIVNFAWMVDRSQKRLEAERQNGKEKEGEITEETSMLKEFYENKEM